MTLSASLFVYGTLRHLPLLEAVLGHVPEVVPARLGGHRVMAVQDETHPAIREATGEVAEGLLLTCLSDADRARLDCYEGDYPYSLRIVTVETDKGTRETQAYFPPDDGAPAGGAWSLEDWIPRHGDATVIAAREVMSLMPEFTAEELKTRYPTILLRAWSAVRAGAAPVPVEVRRGMEAEEVDVLKARQPYTQYFAVAEHDLRFPLFGGGMSETVTRAAFLSGDAVTLLPYDPVRDRVLVIEQFRFGIYMRGDPSPWSLEPVAGRIDPGEDPETAARREAIEEAGLSVGELHRIGAYYPSPGALTEHLVSYVGIADIPDDATGIGGEASEAEDILSHIVSFQDLMGLVDSGEAANGPLILSAQWLALNRDRLRGG